MSLPPIHQAVQGEVPLCEKDGKGRGVSWLFVYDIPWDKHGLFSYGYTRFHAYDRMNPSPPHTFMLP